MKDVCDKGGRGSRRAETDNHDHPVLRLSRSFAVPKKPDYLVFTQTLRQLLEAIRRYSLDSRFSLRLKMNIGNHRVTSEKKHMFQTNPSLKRTFLFLSVILLMVALMAVALLEPREAIARVRLASVQ